MCATLKQKFVLDKKTLHKFTWMIYDQLNSKQSLKCVETSQNKLCCRREPKQSDELNNKSCFLS